MDMVKEGAQKGMSADEEWGCREGNVRSGVEWMRNAFVSKEPITRTSGTATASPCH